MYSVPNNFDRHKLEQEMTKREYIEDQDAEDPDDFIISLTTQVCTYVPLTTEGIYRKSTVRESSQGITYEE